MSDCTSKTQNINPFPVAFYFLSQTKPKLNSEGIQNQTTDTERSQVINPLIEACAQQEQLRFLS